MEGRKVIWVLRGLQGGLCTRSNFRLQRSEFKRNEISESVLLPVIQNRPARVQTPQHADLTKTRAHSVAHATLSCHIVCNTGHVWTALAQTDSNGAVWKWASSWKSDWHKISELILQRVHVSICWKHATETNKQMKSMTTRKSFLLLFIPALTSDTFWICFTIFGLCVFYFCVFYFILL